MKFKTQIKIQDKIYTLMCKAQLIWKVKYYKLLCRTYIQKYKIHFLLLFIRVPVVLMYIMRTNRHTAKY
jgi:hypothetical protein